MQSENLNDTSRILGFRMGTKVRIAKRFFDNHQMRYINLGTGEVIGKHMADNELPKILVKMTFHALMRVNANLKKLLLPSTHGSVLSGYSVIISIHPLYLEKVEEKKKRGKKINTSA